MGRRSDFDVAALDYTLGTSAAGDHLLTAHVGGQPVGHIEWNPTHGRVEMIKAERDYRGQGVASALWGAAHVHAARHGLVSPVHSDIHSQAGAHWMNKQIAQSGPKPMGRKRVSRQPVEGQESLF